MFKKNKKKDVFANDGLGGDKTNPVTDQSTTTAEPKPKVSQPSPETKRAAVKDDTSTGSPAKVSTLGVDVDNGNLTLEQIEVREQARREAALQEAEKEQKREERNNFFKSFKTSYTIVMYLTFAIALTVYIWWVSNVLLIGVIAGLLLAMPLTFWFVFKSGELNVYEGELNDLASVATDINFQMGTGKNVANTLSHIKGSYDGRVGADLDYVYNKLMNDTELDVSVFKKYNFTAFNIFAQNLVIAYREGVSTKRLFAAPIRQINFELTKRDELYRANKSYFNAELITIIISAFIPVSMRLLAGEPYAAFMSYPLITSIATLIVVLVMLLITISIQKRKLDISINS